jgi:AAA domain
MATRTATDKKAAHRIFRSQMRLHNQIVKEVDKTIMNLKRAKELKHRNSILANLIQVMREQGASDQSIRKALPGLEEFTKFADKKMSSSASDQQEHPHPVPDPDEEALGLFLSQIETQEVHWLWEKRIPLGKITILDGDPGMGKSMLALNLAACVSSGRPMPDGTPGQQGGVILIAPEDGAGDTLRPRLEAAGGDPSHVLLLNIVEGLDAKKMAVVDRPFSLSHDLELLEKAIKRTNALLVVLDPLMAVLGHNIDSSRDQDIREVFTPLAQLAERTGCAILIIRHLNKGASENALYRGAGSIGIIAAARIGLLVAQDPYDEHKRILATTKNNLSQQAPHLSYQIEENASAIPYIQWLGENNHPVSTLLNGPTTVSIQRQQLLQVLRDADGPLGPQELAEHTGQKYTSVRLTLGRMHEAGEIIRLSRGKYITPNHPSLLQRSIDTQTTDTTDTSDTNNTLDTTDTSDTILPNLPSVTTHNHHSPPDRWFNAIKANRELIDHMMSLAT